MNINKKYAIRKLAVGVASVSIGMFIANTPEVAQTLGAVGGGGEFSLLIMELKSRVVKQRSNGNLKVIL